MTKGGHSPLQVETITRIKDVSVFPEPLVVKVPVVADLHDWQDSWHWWVWVCFELPLIFLSEDKPATDGSGDRHTGKEGRNRMAGFAATLGVPPLSKVETATHGEPYYLARR